jgi:glycosyltransferase involved in cell wall biosynthesis
MRVVQMIDSLAPGGAERSLAELVRPLVTAGVELDFLLLHERPGLSAEVRTSGADVTVVAGRNRCEWIWNARQIIRSRRPDVVNTTLFDADVVGRVAARLAGVPSVSTLVNTPYGSEHRSEADRLRLGAAQLADLCTARLASRFRAVSSAVKEAYVERLRLDPSLVHIIPEGRDPVRLGIRQPSRRALARRTLGVLDDAPVVLAVGRQEPQKGFDVLIRAVPRMLQADSRTTVFIVGRRGRSSAHLEELLRDLHLDGSVQLLGHREDVPDLLCAADAFVLPSLREGIPGVVQEAMALEAPIVASDIGPVREAIGSDTLGELFPAGNPEALAGAVRQVLENPQLSRSRATAARERFLREFDSSSVAKRVLSFYEGTVESGPSDQRRR